MAPDPASDAEVYATVRNVALRLEQAEDHLRHAHGELRAYGYHHEAQAVAHALGSTQQARQRCADLFRSWGTA
jgi:hypothetical protein